MQAHTRFLHIADEKTQPLPSIRSLDFQLYLDRYALTIRDVALAAHVRMIVVWNILHSNPVLPEDAGKVRSALFILTREHYCGPIPVRATPTQSSDSSRQRLTQRFAHIQP